MASVSKKEKDLYKSLDKLYIKDKGKIISWLDEIKVYKSDDGKIPGLLNSSKIQIITATEEGAYNMILRWIKHNTDKFANYDFTGIPDSAFITTADLVDETDVGTRAAARTNTVKTFKKVEDVERWFKDPEIHPIKGTPMPAMSNEYYNIYVKAYTIMKKNTFEDDYEVTHRLFPKNHYLFGDIDLIYYACVKEYYPELYKNLYRFRDNMLAICELLTEKLEDTADTDTVLETEMELLRNRFNSELKVVPNRHHRQSNSNLVLIKDLIKHFREDLEDAFFEKDYMSRLKYPERMRAIKEGVYNIEGYWFINFLENNKMANGLTPIKYFINVLKRPNHPNWISQALKIYNDYKLTIKDIDDCFNPDSGVVENVEDKKLTLLDDPIDKYFDFYENKLAEIRKPIYSQLIDLSTFKPKDNLKYLNDAQYAEFKKERDRYDTLWNNYKQAQELYERNGQGNSPTPPIKPQFTLPWGKVHTIAKEIDPIHIRDEIIVKFREEYAKLRSVIDEYNSIKNMSYKELKKHVGNSSPSSAEMRLIEGNELLSMTREKFVDNILYDYSDLADKCSENIDILTNEELDDENYPLAKLQLMVRLKVYTPDRKKYRTECIYAPKLYNYLIKCINSKEPFINPVTKAKYTQENIEELMKVMRIIDPSLEVPVFIKHINDRLFKIEYEELTKTYQNLDASFGTTNTFRYYNMYLSRTIDGIKYNVYSICTFPADIEAEGEFATGSADLNSYTMIVNMYKLFNEGRLLYNYLPPYHIPITQRPGEYSYIKPAIHFNRYKFSKNWLNNGAATTKTDFINMFKHYAQEVNNYIF